VEPVPTRAPRLKKAEVLSSNSPALSSSNGTLNVRFLLPADDRFSGEIVAALLYDRGGLESPTLHVNPGDTLNLTVTNNTPASPLGNF